MTASQRSPLRCSRCPDQATHMALVRGPVAEFARAHGETDPQVLAILGAEHHDEDLSWVRKLLRRTR